MTIKIITLITILIAIYLLLYRGDETVAVIRSLGTAAMGTIRTLQGR